MKRTFYMAAVAVMALSVQSCLMEDKDLFSTSAAERLEAYVARYESLLPEAENGWMLEYYPDETRQYGGYVYVLKFKDGKVTAYFELDEKTGHTAGETVTSLYKVIPDDSAVLTFDTYNDYLHYFATPNINDYEAMHGDYEFNLTGISDDKTEVYLRGLRTENKMKLKKLGVSAETYMQKISDMKYNVLARRYTLTIAGATNAKCGFVSGTNTISYSYTVGEEDFSGVIPFCHTDLGIRFYEPVELNGVMYESLVYSDGILSSNDGRVFIQMGAKPSGN